MPRSMMTSIQASDALQRCGVDTKTPPNFFTLDSSTVMALLDEARAFRYRQPKNANGSRARYFYAYLLRSLAKKR